MNIKPVSDYKKPLYALGLAATVMAVSVTGCADFLGGRRPPAGMPTTTVQLEGETTVVLPPKDHTNTDYDITPYLVTSWRFYLESKVVTDPDQLARFAVSKLDKITKSGDLRCEGQYQGYDFLIVRIDKYSEWLKSNDQYNDSTSYNGDYCVEYKRNGAESDLLLVYHDPTERFMVITDCCDNKVICEFFTHGNGDSAENSEFTGNTKFPEKYDRFANNEFYDRIMEAQYAFRWAKENHVVVFDDSKCISGKDMWEAFIFNARMGKPVNVLLADHHSADKKKKTAETLDFYYIDVSFKDDGTADYYVAVRRSDHKKLDASASLEYLKHFSGADDIYVLTNDNEVSAETAEKMKFGPDKGEYIFNHFVLRFGKPE